MPSFSEALTAALDAVQAHRALAEDLERLSIYGPPRRPSSEEDATAFEASAEALAEALADVETASIVAHEAALIASQAPPRTPRLREVSAPTALELWPDVDGEPEWSWLAHPDLFETLAAAEARIEASIALLS